MGMLDELLGGGQIQKEYRDFVNRYEQGDPSEGYSDQEVLKRYGEVSHAVSPDQYAQAAQEALSKLSPEERAAFVKILQDRVCAELASSVATKTSPSSRLNPRLHPRVHLVEVVELDVVDHGGGRKVEAGNVLEAPDRHLADAKILCELAVPNPSTALGEWLDFAEIV